MKVWIVLLLLLTGCTSTEVERIPCEDLLISFSNESHDDFLLQSCFVKAHQICDNPEGECGVNHVYSCLEQYFSLKLTQTKDYRAQKCWRKTVDQY